MEATQKTATLDTDTDSQNGKKVKAKIIHLHVCCSCIFLKGVWMGRLNSDVTEGLKLWIPSSKLQIKFSDADLAKVSGSTPGALALNLLTTMFSTKQLSYGKCTETKERW